MKSNLIMIALLLIATVSFSQTKESKSDEKPLRKIASGTGAKQINEEVQREVELAMKELKVELKNLDVIINTEVMKSLEGLDVEINESLKDLDVDINESIKESLKALDHLDIDIDFDGDEFDRDRSIEEFRKEALKDDFKKEEPKKAPKKKDE